MRSSLAAVLPCLLVVACAGPLGGAPLVLTEVPNGASGRADVVRAATRYGCAVEARPADLRLACREGDLEVPTFPGPPTFAVRCVDHRLDVGACRALVRRILLSGEPGPKAS